MQGKIICSWCKKDMGEKEVAGGFISHGLCLDCARVENIKLDFDELDVTLDRCISLAGVMK